MLILACDLARIAGYAIGEAGKPPESGSWCLGAVGQDVRTLPPELVRRLNEITAGRRPDLLAIENFMSPAASKNQNATISQLLLHGAFNAWAGMSRIRTVYEGASTIRKHICGRGHASGDTKAMVLRTAVTLGLVPRGCTDHNRADACIVHAWASAMHGGARQQLLLTA